MPDHAIKKVRVAIAAVLEGAEIEITVDGAPRAVTVLDHPPTSGLLDAGAIPGLFVFVRGERIEELAQSGRSRSYMVDVVAQVEAAADGYMDALDELHLAAELAIMTDPKLGGVAFNTVPQGSDVLVERGEAVFASRRITFATEVLTRRLDPSQPFT